MALKQNNIYIALLFHTSKSTTVELLTIITLIVNIRTFYNISILNLIFKQNICTHSTLYNHNESIK